MKKTVAMLVLSLVVVACDPAEFRPAKGVRDLPSAKNAYRVHDSGCDSIGFVIKAESIDDIATTAARHGATEFKVLNDRVSTTTETDFTATKSFGVTHGHATSTEEKHHLFTAEAFRCPTPGR